MQAIQRSFVAAALYLLSKGPSKVKPSSFLIRSVCLSNVYPCCSVIMTRAVLLHGSDIACCSAVKLATVHSIAEGALAVLGKAISLHRVW